MACKLVLFAVISLAFGSVFAEQDNELCICRNEASKEELKDLWKLLRDISAKIDETDEDRTKYSVLPAVLSPNVPCANCIENTRRKRKIFPDPVEDYSDSVEMEDRIPALLDKRCPKSFVRLGFMCVNAAFLK